MSDARVAIRVGWLNFNSFLIVLQCYKRFGFEDMNITQSEECIGLFSAVMKSVLVAFRGQRQILFIVINITQIQVGVR